jgi:uncharacterized protein YjbJ (UPF0337 family)
MKTSSRDKAEGKFHKIKGKLNGVAGVITDDIEREIKGKAENIAGRVQEKIGQVKKVFGK